jgi:hypothetical protein
MGQGASSKFQGCRDARALLMRHLFFAQDSQNIERASSTLQIPPSHKTFSIRAAPKLLVQCNTAAEVPMR